MEKTEMVEKLREKADVTYDEAKLILEGTNWNLLDAVIAVEKEGLIKNTENISYSTKQTTYNETELKEEKRKATLGDSMKKFFGWCKDVAEKGCRNNLCISHNGVIKAEIPLIVLAVLLIPAWEIIGIVLLIVFFKGYSFSVTGDDYGTDKVNEVMSKIKFRRDADDDIIDLDDRK